ncbi:hypothetical protein D3C85_1717770 [compost metagenome]
MLLVGKCGTAGQHLGEQGVEALDQLHTWQRLGDFLRCTGAVADGQTHVVGCQRVGDVDDHFAFETAQTFQRG